MSWPLCSASCTLSTLAVGGSSPDRSSGGGMDSADMAGTCDVGGHAAGEVGAGDIEEADDNHRTPPNEGRAQTREKSRARDMARACKERRWVHMGG